MLHALDSQPDTISSAAPDESKSFLVARFNSQGSDTSATVTSGGSGEIPEMKVEEKSCCEITKTAFIIGLFNCAVDYSKGHPNQAIAAGLVGVALVGGAATVGVMYAGSAIVNAVGSTGIVSSAIKAGAGVVSAGAGMLFNHGIRWCFFKPAVDEYGMRHALVSDAISGSPRPHTDLRKPSTAVDVNQRKRGTSKSKRRIAELTVGSHGQTVPAKDPVTPAPNKEAPAAATPTVPIAIGSESAHEPVTITVGSAPKP